MHKRRGSETRNLIHDVIYILLGITSASIGLSAFLIPNQFLDGGVTGISLLINNLTGIDLSLLIILINIPFILIGFRQFSLDFVIKTMLAILGLAVFVYFENIPSITHDKLLIAIFGGFFLGAGIGLSIRGGAVLDGTEVLAVFISRHSGLSVGDIIFIFNIVLFSTAAWLLNIEVALYAILTYIVASRAINYFIKGFEGYVAITIMSKNHEAIRKHLVFNMLCGVTVLRGKGGMQYHGVNHNENDVLYTVVTRLEVVNIINEINKVDSNAFIVQHNVHDIHGGLVIRRPRFGKKEIK